MFLIFGLNGYRYSVLSKNLAEYYAPWPKCLPSHYHPASPCISITISAFGMSPLAVITIVDLFFIL